MPHDGPHPARQGQSTHVGSARSATPVGLAGLVVVLTVPLVPLPVVLSGLALAIALSIGRGIAPSPAPSNAPQEPDSVDTTAD